MDNKNKLLNYFYGKIIAPQEFCSYMAVAAHEGDWVAYEQNKLNWQKADLELEDALKKLITLSQVDLFIALHGVE